jgi:ribosomal protein S18 acetylase RimI-like enzyme
MEMKIREFHHSDIPHLMEICLKTGDDGKDGTDCYSDPHFIGQLYALPYVIHNPELCMVVHEHEIPVGYILGTDDTKEFYRWMENQYLPTLRRRYPSGMQCASRTEEFFLSLMHTDRSLVEVDPRFPSHLHINLLPTAQGKGLGHQLITRFTEKLSELGSRGAYLHTGPENGKAIAFYQRNGFEIIEEKPGSVKLALSLM